MIVLRILLTLILCLPVAYLAVILYTGTHNDTVKKSGRKNR
ncbi:MAG: hypothetical protein SPI84_03440 [Anaerovoracaceae bacterium]|nr:hypothetical protein [Bacillota bacterium]MDY5975677.1 hypothetical protein [Anaerovoracaceae bacterium]